MEKFILGIDQSTRGTKAILFDNKGRIAGRSDVLHKQIINQRGWIEHDPEEIYKNMCKAVKTVIDDAHVDTKQIDAIGISNQRETVAAWNRRTGKPIYNAIVWQCARADSICKTISESQSEAVKARTGLPLSPYFSAAKLRWIIENVPEAKALMESGELCCGTIDSWLLYCMTEGRCFKTDYSNASRTQLFNISTLSWDEELCNIFKVNIKCLPQAADSGSVFGYTDLGGILAGKIPICSMIGDSQAALFGEGCHKKGMVKATCGTGASVMMNIGNSAYKKIDNLAVSIAWGIQGDIAYVMEGNINYAGAVLNWLKEDMGIVQDFDEVQTAAARANPNDTTYFVPAFSGLGAPHWKAGACAAVTGMTRKTGKPEFIKAALESIGYQIADIVSDMEAESGICPNMLKCDGGVSNNQYLMQFISDILKLPVYVERDNELSCAGAAYIAGLVSGLYKAEQLFSKRKPRCYSPVMADLIRERKYEGWQKAVKHTYDQC